MDRLDYEKLCEDAWEHNRHYYIEHNPIIADEEFDYLLKKIEAAEKLHPEWITPQSPTQRVNEVLTKDFATIVHRTPMLSLANTYSYNELEDYIVRMVKLTGKKELSFSCELKMDGIAVSVLYENGMFVRGVTRGDGWQGDDVSANIRTIASLPLRLYGPSIPEVLEVRGEVFMEHATFLKLNKMRETAGEARWANPRNAAAGALKLLDPKESAQRKLTIAFYGLAEESTTNVKSQHNIHEYLKSLGLPTLKQIGFCRSLSEIKSFVEAVSEIRKALPFDIDGVVIKLDDLAEQRRMGVTAKNPRWAVAYKFAATQAETEIESITVQVGRTGTLTPVAELKPVFLAGSTIARATLHNEEEVQRKDIREGDRVVIEKGGDVIPKVVRVLFDSRKETSQPWRMPQFCPTCHTPIYRAEGEVAVRCPNTKQCPDQLLGRMIHFVGKSAMDIENMGEKVTEHLINKGFVSRPSDIYHLTSHELSQLDSFKEKSIQNLLASIEKSKNVSLGRFIMGLGIHHVGVGTAELLANKTGSIERMREMTQDEFMHIEGIGEIVAKSIIDYFQDTQNQEEVERLLAAGIKPAVFAVTTFVDHPFAEKTFVITGTLPNYTRNSAATLIKERGGKVTDSVSKKTDFVLAGAEPGSKLEKAVKLNIRILSEDEFTKAL